MGKSLWSIESVPIKMTWMISMRKSLSKWSDLMRNEWIEWNEVKWVIWRIWLGTPSKWLEWTLWESPYELRMSVPIKVTWDEWFDQTLSKWMESMRNEWIEVNRVKWVNWRIWLCEPYGKIPMVRTRCPYESDLRWVIWSNPIKMIRFNEKWMNWSE